MQSELRRGIWLLLLGFLVMFAPSSAERAEPAAPAKIHVTGLGPWRDREMRVALERMLPKDRGPTLGANAIEDTAFLLFSVLNDEGFQSPAIAIRAKSPAGKIGTYKLNESLEFNLPRDLEADEVRFDVKTGPRSYVETVKIEGLKAGIPCIDVYTEYQSEHPMER